MSVQVQQPTQTTVRPSKGNNRRGTPPTPGLSADPDLRDQQKIAQPPKVVRGVPALFRDDTNAGERNIGTIQPELHGFKELKSRTTVIRCRTLEEFLVMTSTTFSEHSQCVICQGLLNAAICMHWDQEGRSACEECIREALSKHHICPITGKEVTPDDLHPNRAIQHAADHFRANGSTQMEAIERPSSEGELQDRGVSSRPRSGRGRDNHIGTDFASPHQRYNRSSHGERVSSLTLSFSLPYLLCLFL